MRRLTYAALEEYWKRLDERHRRSSDAWRSAKHIMLLILLAAAFLIFYLLSHLLDALGMLK